MPGSIGNQNALGNEGGRPALFETPDQLSDAIQAYFDKQVENKGIITVSGLAYALGFVSRQSLYDYKERAEFSYIIKRATLFVETCYEEKLSTPACTGSIFALKNMGWRDKSETELSGGLAITPISGMEIH